jgi:hypothetical protein
MERDGMVARTIAITGCVLFAAMAALCGTAAAKDQSRLPLENFDLAQEQAPPPAPAPETPPAPETDAPPADPGAEPPPAEEPPAVEEEPPADDELSLGEIPVVETMELTADVAKRAIDAYAMVKDKYKDADLESFETLQDFVDQTTDGKAFDTDVKSFGFAAVNEWNTAITSISIAYLALNDDPTADIKAQIEEIRNDTELAQDMKDRMIASLTATIPSENNLRVVREVNMDAVYAEKLKLLATEAEGE